MLVYHQVIHCKMIANHLIFLIQSRMEGLNINNPPKFLADNTYENTHAIIVNESLNPNQPLIILVMLKGVTIYLPYISTIESDYEDESILNIDMTSESLVWEPSEVSFADQEDVM